MNRKLRNEIETRTRQTIPSAFISILVILSGAAPNEVRQRGAKDHCTLLLTSTAAGNLPAQPPNSSRPQFHSSKSVILSPWPNSHVILSAAAPNEVRQRGAKDLDAPHLPQRRKASSAIPEPHRLYLAITKPHVPR
jgi:hypothetical protein